MIEYFHRSGRRGNHELAVHGNAAGPVVALIRVIVPPDFLTRLDVNADDKAVDELSYILSRISSTNIQVVAIDRQRRARLSFGTNSRSHPNRLELVDRQRLYRSAVERHHDQTLCVHRASGVAYARLKLGRRGHLARLAVDLKELIIDRQIDIAIDDYRLAGICIASANILLIVKRPSLRRGARGGIGIRHSISKAVGVRFGIDGAIGVRLNDNAAHKLGRTLAIDQIAPNELIAGVELGLVQAVIDTSTVDVRLPVAG